MRIFDLDNNSCVEHVRTFNSSKRLATALRNKYDYLSAYHGTNISQNESQSIRQSGLQRASRDLLIEKAKIRFISVEDHKDMQRSISDRIHEFYTTKDHITVGEINLTLDKSPLQDEAYQYLLFGAESMLPLADKLRREFRINFRKRMADFGVPTIIKTLVPLIDVNDCWLENIYEHINNDWIECCVVIRADIPSHNVLELQQVEPPYDKYGFLWI